MGVGVEWIVRVDIPADIGDGDCQMPATRIVRILVCLRPYRVIEIPRVFVIDGDQRQRPKIFAIIHGRRKELEIVGVGYRAEAQGPNALRLNLGFSHPVNVTAPDGITFEVPAPTQVTVNGIDKEVVGQVAANIRSIRKPEPYKGKGVRYAGERILRKAGKAGKK